MITINKNTANTVVVTLNEKTTLAPVYYLMELFNNQSNTTKVLNLYTEYSTNITRWNEFIITENVVENLLQATITLDEGTYDYKIYESSFNDLDLNNAGDIVESGKLVVIGPVKPIATNQNLKTKVVYNG